MKNFDDVAGTEIKANNQSDTNKSELTSQANPDIENKKAEDAKVAKELVGVFDFYNPRRTVGSSVLTQNGTKSPETEKPREQLARMQNLDRDPHFNYKYVDGQIIDSSKQNKIIKDRNLIPRETAKIIMNTLGGELDGNGNIIIGSGEKKFTLKTNAGSLVGKKNESTYNMSKDDFTKLTEEINSERFRSKFDVSSMGANFGFTDGETYEGEIGVGVKKILEKGDFVFKAGIKKMINVLDRDHVLFFKCERTLGRSFQKLLGGVAFSLDKQGKMILRLSHQDLNKLTEVSLDQYGKKSFLGHQYSTAAELIYHMDGFVRELALSYVSSKSDNHSFGLLGSQLVTDPAYTQYFEDTGFFQGAKRDAVKARIEVELAERLALGASFGGEMVQYNSLGNDQLGNKIVTADNKKIGFTSELYLRWQSENGRWRVKPKVNMSTTMSGLGAGIQYKGSKRSTTDFEAGVTKHASGSKRPTEFKAGLQTTYTFGGPDDKDRDDGFGPLFEPTLTKKSKNLLDRLYKSKDKPLSKKDCQDIVNTMRTKSTEDLLDNEFFVEVVNVFLYKLGIIEAPLAFSSPNDLASTIGIIDKELRERYKAKILSAADINYGEFGAKELDKINKVRTGASFADGDTDIHGEEIEGRGKVIRTSIVKSATGSGVEVKSDGSINIDGSASGKLVFPAKASSSNPSSLANLFDVKGASTIYVSPDNVKKLPLGTINLNFAETGAPTTYFNISVTIVHGSISFQVGALTNKISGMNERLSNAMVRGEINSTIQASLLTGTQLSIATATDMHFVEGNFASRSGIVNNFISGTGVTGGTAYSYLVMNGVRAGSYTDPQLTQLNNGSLTNAAAEAILSGGGAPSSAPGSFDLSGGSDTGISSTDDYTSNNTPTYTWAAVAGATSYEFSTDGGTTYTDIGNVLTYTVPSALTDGVKTIKVRAKNGTGTGPASTLTTTIDTSNIVTIGDFDAGTTPDIKSSDYLNRIMNFAGEDIAELVDVTCSGGGVVTNKSLSSASKIKFDLHTPNLAGALLSFIFKDKAGNQKTLTKPLSLPNDPVSAPSSTPGSFTLTSDTGISSTDLYTSNTTPTFTWAAVAGATSYEFSTDNGGTYTDIGNVLTYTVPSALTDGAKNIKIRAKNSAGTGPANTLAINIDTSNIVTIGDFDPDTTPDSQGSNYPNRIMNFAGEDIYEIVSVTSSTGGTISNVSLTSASKVKFDWITPNALGSTLSFTVRDQAGNQRVLNKPVSLPNGLNHNPEFSVGSVADTLIIGSDGSYALPTATDADVGDTLTYSFDTSRIGTGIAFDTATGIMTGGIIDGPARTETIPYTVNDGHGGTATINVIFTISG